MHFLLITVAIIIGVLFTLWFVWHLIVLVFSLIGFHHITKFFERRKRRELLNISHFHKRLSIVVEDLMIRFDDLDQESQYMPAVVDKKWTTAVGSSCAELVEISERLKAVGVLIEEKNVSDSRESMLLAVRDTVRIQRRYSEMKTRMETAFRLAAELSEQTTSISESNEEVKLIEEVKVDSMPDGSTIVHGETEREKIERSRRHDSENGG